MGPCLSRLWLSWFFGPEQRECLGKCSLQKCPKYCWEFHDNGSERPSPEPLLKKEASPAVLGGREFWSHALETLKCLKIIGLGDPSRTLEGNSRKRSERVSGVFPEFFRNFLPENPSRTGGMAHLCSPDSGEPSKMNSSNGSSNFDILRLF